MSVLSTIRLPTAVIEQISILTACRIGFSRRGICDSFLGGFGMPAASGLPEMRLRPRSPPPSATPEGSGHAQRHTEQRKVGRRRFRHIRGRVRDKYGYRGAQRQADGGGIDNGIEHRVIRAAPIDIVSDCNKISVAIQTFPS